MTITEPVYATREMVKRAMEILETARANLQIDRLLQSCSRSIDGELHRTFYPRISSFTLEDGQTWFDDREFVSVSSLALDGVPLSASDYVLRPIYGPPYNHVDLYGSTTTIISGVLSGTGVLGFTLDLVNVGGLVAAININVSTLTIPDGSLVGVGDLIKIDSEYLLVVGRGWLDSTQNLQADMSASAATVTVAVTDGTAFFVDEIILLDSERMLIVDIAGNNLTVKRAWDGSTLATHSASDIYVPRSLTVTRGVVGSTAASHLISTTVYRWNPPSLVNQLCIGEVLAAIEQEQSSYARVVGSGDNAFEARGVGLEDLRIRTCGALGRKARHRAV